MIYEAFIKIKKLSLLFNKNILKMFYGVLMFKLGLPAIFMLN